MDYLANAERKKQRMVSVLVTGKIDEVELEATSRGYVQIKSMVVDGVKFEFTIDCGEAAIVCYDEAVPWIEEGEQNVSTGSS